MPYCLRRFCTEQMSAMSVDCEDGESYSMGSFGRQSGPAYPTHTRSMLMPRAEGPARERALPSPGQVDGMDLAWACDPIARLAYHVPRCCTMSIAKRTLHPPIHLNWNISD